MALASHPKSATEFRTLANLKEKINKLEGINRRFAHTVPVSDGIDGSLPYRGLPLGCVHEIKGSSLASAIAFASLLSARISRRGAILYVTPDHSFYPLGLLPYHVKLEQWIDASARCSRDLAWTVLEAIRCPQVSAVLAVVKAADLNFCRRLQLAAESSGATGFLLGNTTSSSVASAITRWRVSSVISPPARGFDEIFWELELLYCRSGRPGKWMAAWRNGKLETLGSLSELTTRPMQRVTLVSENALAG